VRDRKNSLAEICVDKVKLIVYFTWHFGQK
jgi:hypothetical protein